MRPAAQASTKIARIGGRRPPPADGVSDRAGAVPTATATPRGGEDGQARRLPDHAPPGNLTEVRCARWYARPAANGPGAPPRMRRPHGPQAALRGCSSMVELEPSKHVTRVRFSSPAPDVARSNPDPLRGGLLCYDAGSGADEWGGRPRSAAPARCAPRWSQGPGEP